MSTLRLLIETALFRPLSAEKQKSYLEKMSSELTRLEQTSEQVLAAAQLEHSETAPILESLELNSVVQGIIGKARHGLEARGANLTVNYSPEPLPVSIDARAFSVVLNNLLDNAVKYSPSVPKILKVGLERQNDLIFVHVDDEGIGIPEAELKKVFERFYRVGNEMTRESKGVGLGLHLVKSITEAMNGWVRVENNPSGNGTRFTIVLPRRVALTQDELKMQPISGGNV
jgi:two-component system, OmpR family, sensor histidine kinase SenX3